MNGVNELTNEIIKAAIEVHRTAWPPQVAEWRRWMVELHRDLDLLEEPTDPNRLGPHFLLPSYS